MSNPDPILPMPTRVPGDTLANADYVKVEEGTATRVGPCQYHLAPGGKYRYALYGVSTGTILTFESGARAVWI